MNRLSIIIISVMALYIIGMHSCNGGDRELANNLRINEEKLRTTEEENGSLRSTIGSMEGNRAKDLLSLQGLDSSITLLQNEVKKYGKNLQSTAYAKTTTIYVTGKETTIIATDTIISNDTVYIYPTYNSSREGEWIDWDVTASRDTAFLKLNVKNKFVFTHRLEKQGLFKPKRSVFDVKSLNPHTTTVDAKSFVVKQKAKNFSIGPMAGLSFTGTPIFGVGIQFGLIKF